jgi:hypothetical protein
MTSTRQDFDIYQGQAVTVTVTVYPTEGAALPTSIIGWDLEATFAPVTTLRVDADLTKTNGDGITITNGAGGICTVALTADDTTTMESGDWEWSLWLIDSGSEAPLSIGTITVLETARSRSDT